MTCPWQSEFQWVEIMPLSDLGLWTILTYSSVLLVVLPGYNNAVHLICYGPCFMWLDPVRVQFGISVYVRSQWGQERTCWWVNFLLFRMSLKRFCSKLTHACLCERLPAWSVLRVLLQLLWGTNSHAGDVGFKADLKAFAEVCLETSHRTQLFPDLDKSRPSWWHMPSKPNLHFENVNSNHNFMTMPFTGLPVFDLLLYRLAATVQYQTPLPCPSLILPLPRLHPVTWSTHFTRLLCHDITVIVDQA